MRVERQAMSEVRSIGFLKDICVRKTGVGMSIDDTITISVKCHDVHSRIYLLRIVLRTKSVGIFLTQNLEIPGIYAVDKTVDSTPDFDRFTRKTRE